MKLATKTLIVLALLAAAYFAASVPARAGALDLSPQFTSKSAAASQVDADLDEALRVARTGRVVRDEVFKLDVSMKIEELSWSGIPNPCHIQKLLDAELADLHARANAFRATEMDFLQLQFQIVLGRLERAASQIEWDAKYGKYDVDVAEKAIDQLRVEAFDYLESLGMTDIRATLQEAVTALLDRAMHAEDQAIAQQEAYVKFYTVRLEAALAVLQARVTKGVATKQDYLRIADYVAALERLQTMSTPFDCGS